MALTAVLPIYAHVQFGEPRVAGEFETFTMTVEDFETLGVKVANHLRERQCDFRYVTQMFVHYCTALTELGVHLFIEELSILIDELSDDEQAVSQLKQIYSALKLQAYSEQRIVVQLVK